MSTRALPETSHRNVLRLPLFPRDGGRIGLVAPSEGSPRTDIKNAIRYFTGCGYELVPASHLTNTRDGAFSLASPYQIGQEITGFFADTSICAVLAARGGASAPLVRPYIDYDVVRKNPKPFIGYSDITSLLLAVTAQTNMVTMHGPNASGLPGASRFTRENFWRTIGAGKRGVFHEFDEQKVLSHGPRVRGVAMGGNLEAIFQTFGSEKYDPFKNLKRLPVVLFWEEYNAQPSDMLLMLSALADRGLFQNVCAMLVGHCVGCKENGYPDAPSLSETLRSVAERHRIPVVHRLNFGHSDNRATIPLNSLVELDTRSGRVKFFDYNSDGR